MSNVRIDVSSRPSWFQMTMFPIGSRELADRMRLIAQHDLRRFNSIDTVTVEAVDETSGARTKHVESEHQLECPHCGRQLNVETA